jgi:dienelactone hydrolase
LSGFEWLRFARYSALAVVVAAVCGCGSAAANSSAESREAAGSAVVPLPTRLADGLTFEQTLPLFEYDRSVPFDVRQISSYPRGAAEFADITYMGATGIRLPAYIVTPGGRGPFAGVIWMGWTGGFSQIRNEFVDEALDLARHGVVSLLVSGYFPWYVAPSDKDTDRMSMIGQIRELRRAIDFLGSLPGVDPSRIAFVGHSMSAMHGADLAAVDHRVKAAVLMAPHATMTDWVFAGYGLEKSTEPGYRAAMSSFDPLAFVPYSSPTALFFEFARDDLFVPVAVSRTLYDAASEPKQIGWYGGGHDLDEAARVDRDAWLAARLNLASQP